MSSIRIDPKTSYIVVGAVQHAVTAFLVEGQSRQLAPGTLRSYVGELNRFCAFCDRLGVYTLAELDPGTIRQYLLELSERRNPGGVHASYRVIRAWLRWSWLEFEVEGRNPITRVEPPKTNPQPLPGVSLETVRAMLRACTTDQGQRDRAILLCLLDTGARAAEFVSLNVEDVDLISGAVTIHHGKGGKFRVVFLGRRARRELRRLLKSRQNLTAKAPLWITNTGERLTRAGLRQVLRRRALAAGLPEPGAHDFRRAFALAMLRNGCDLVTLARLMGHSGLSILQRYLAQTVEDLGQAHAQHSPVDRAF